MQYSNFMFGHDGTHTHRTTLFFPWINGITDLWHIKSQRTLHSPLPLQASPLFFAPRFACCRVNDNRESGKQSTYSGAGAVARYPIHLSTARTHACCRCEIECFFCSEFVSILRWNSIEHCCGMSNWNVGRIYRSIWVADVCALRASIYFCF